MAFIRQGECNRCGQCCGADGSPNQANPWPVNWYESHQKWSYDDFNTHWPYAVLFGIVPDGNGNPIKFEENGEVRVVGQGGGRYPYVWVDGRPCKDTSQGGDGSSYSLECPFLKDDPGDGSRPCGLAGSAARLQDYMTVCFPEGPERFETQAMLDQWETDHPLCSHTWVEE